jgi:pimeloyl-ACP methyl ester carboxylesterase
VKALSSLLGLLILILSPALGAAAERVVILHGIARTSAHMAPLADHLAAEGYDVLNLDYPSTEHPLEKLIETTREDVKERLAGTEETVHFVGYSMGGLVVRGMLNGWRPEALGRVVLLAVPNSGSEVATFLRGNVLFDAYFGPAGKQLAADDPETQALLRCHPGRRRRQSGGRTDQASRHEGFRPRPRKPPVFPGNQGRAAPNGAFPEIRTVRPGKLRLTSFRFPLSCCFELQAHALGRLPVLASVNQRKVVEPCPANAN